MVRGAMLSLLAGSLLGLSTGWQGQMKMLPFDGNRLAVAQVQPAGLTNQDVRYAALDPDQPFLPPSVGPPRNRPVDPNPPEYDGPDAAPSYQWVADMAPPSGLTPKIEDQPNGLMPRDIDRPPTVEHIYSGDLTDFDALRNAPEDPSIGQVGLSSGQGMLSREPAAPPCGQPMILPIIDEMTNGPCAAPENPDEAIPSTQPALPTPSGYVLTDREDYGAYRGHGDDNYYGRYSEIRGEGGRGGGFRGGGFRGGEGFRGGDRDDWRWRGGGGDRDDQFLWGNPYGYYPYGWGRPYDRDDDIGLPMISPAPHGLSI